MIPITAGGYKRLLKVILHILNFLFETFRIFKQLLKKDRKSTRLNSSHVSISYAVFCLKKKKNNPVELADNDIRLQPRTENDIENIRQQDVGETRRQQDTEAECHEATKDKPEMSDHDRS